MSFLIFVSFFLLFLFSDVFRCFIFHLPQYLIKKIQDIYFTLKYRKYNDPPFDGMKIISGCSQQPMGSGKTLYGSNFIQHIYKRYNNKITKDKNNNTIVNKIVIYSNIKLYDIPYIEFNSFEQIIQFSKNNQNQEDFNSKQSNKKLIRLHLYVLLDESSVMINSRNFKDNFSIETINELCQVRHNHINGLYFTSQTYDMVDISIRRLSSYVDTCQMIDIPFLKYKKRFLKIRRYIERDLEECTSELMIKPYRQFVYFIDDNLHSKFRYGNYDTYQMAGKILKKIDEKDYLSDKDFMESIINLDKNSIETVHKTSRKYRKQQKKMYK